MADFKSIVVSVLASMATSADNGWRYTSAGLKFFSDHFTLMGIAPAIILQALVWRYVIKKINGNIGRLEEFVHSVPSQEAINSGLVTLVSIVNKVNAVIPVDAILTATLTYITFRVMWAGYKFIKSWIPTLAGS